MDHIPYPSHLNIPPVGVPYLGIFEFDHGEFNTFDKRLVTKGLIIDEYSSDHVAALVQAWLYFGLLEAFIGKEIDKNMFLRKARSSETFCTDYVIDSSSLTGLLQDCVKRFRRKIIWKERQKQLRMWCNVLDFAQTEIEYQVETGERDEVSAAIFLSINVLITTLRDFYFRMDFIRSFQMLNWGGYPSPMNRQMPQYVPVLRHKVHDDRSAGALLLIKRMKEAGWCVHQLSQFLNNLDFVAAYYLSSIPRIEDVTHESCTEARCVAYNTNEEKYVTKHLKNACKCDMIDTPYQAINRIVAAEGIPLIRIKNRPGTQPLLDVVECKAHTEYTAISHVWIDGLGNPNSNGLPRCQIEKLAEHMIYLEQQSWISRLWRILRRTHQTPLVWIDTLCVPVKPEHKDLRRKVINGMSLIYGGAKQVLVLDDELRSIDSKTEPIELLHARIFSSKWNSRSWTLQEGALAQKCYFQFRDNALRLASIEQTSLASLFRLLLRALKHPWGFLLCVWELWYFPSRYRLFSNGAPVFLKNPLPSGFQTMTEYIQRSFHILVSTRFDLGLPEEANQLIMIQWINRVSHQAPSLRHKFERTWNMLGQRTTTYANDLHIIIANLTGFNVSQMIALMTPFERTKTMLHCIGSFDIGFMFNEYPRQNIGEDCADRWIPSFPTLDQLDDEVRLAIEERGITLSKPKANGLLALMINPGCSVQKFWVRYEWLCPDPTCGCRKEELHSAINSAQNNAVYTREDRPEDELLGNSEEIYENSLEGWLQQWPSDPAYSMFEPSIFEPSISYATNSEGKHVLYVWYYVDCKLPEDDKLDRSRYEDKSACIILFTPQSSCSYNTLRGARFLETGRPEADGKVHLRYDCPLIYKICTMAPNASQFRGALIIPITRELSYKDILIEFETDPQIHTKYPTRDQNISLYSSRFVLDTTGTILITACVVILVAWTAVMMIRNIICIQVSQKPALNLGRGGSL